VRYHRRGPAGSARATAPFGIAQRAADCLALLRYLGLERAHVVGHSSAGTMALQLALDARIAALAAPPGAGGPGPRAAAAPTAAVPAGPEAVPSLALTGAAALAGLVGFRRRQARPR